MTNVKTSMNHPQSNGKLERFHGTIKSEAIRNMPKFTLVQMKKEVGEWIHHYNYKRPSFVFRLRCSNGCHGRSARFYFIRTKAKIT
jgi:hypothetical protein